MPGAAPVYLLDGIAIARACEEHGLAVLRTTIPVCVPDLELFEALRGSLLPLDERSPLRQHPGVTPPWRALVGTLILASSLLGGCGVKPPPSQFPSGQAALDRMHATFDCARGVKGEAKIDHLSEKGRVRGNLLFFAIEPASVRFDVVSPFGATLLTLTSDGRSFTLNDLKEKKFLEGPSSACNIARITQVPIPGHALVSLLHGEAPVLVHQPDAAQIRWDSDGYYVVDVPSTNGATETVHLAPTPDDFQKPWSEQRLRVLKVRVEQQSTELYRAEMKDHAPAQMSGALVDEDNIEPPIPPSGPMCSVEIPRRIHVEVPNTDDDVLFRYDDVKLNPPLIEGLFTQPVPGGVQRIRVGACEK
jgi:hypothetical protein